MRLQATSSFFIYLTTSFSLSSSHLPPRCSFLLVPASSSSLLPPRPSFFLPRPALSQSESIKVHFSSILTKALRTDGRTNGRTKVSYRVASPQRKTINQGRIHTKFVLGRISFGGKITMKNNNKGALYCQACAVSEVALKFQNFIVESYFM